MVKLDILRHFELKLNFWLFELKMLNWNYVLLFEIVKLKLFIDLLF